MCNPDLDYCNYLLLLGHNPMATGGAVDVIQYAEARERGMKVVVIDPVFTATAAKADEWIPIKPGTDTAFLLSLIHVVIHELKTYDAPFLKSMTNSPYLVESDGYFLRELSEDKPLVWDLTANQAKPYDDPTLGDLALEGNYYVGGQEARPSFQVLKDHVKGYTPEWAQGVTEINASVIRRIAKEFVEAARIGSSIQIEGKRLPYRPVSTRIGRGVNGVARAYQAGLADHILIMLVGALETVGGHKGGSVHKPGTIHSTGIIPGKDGMMHQGYLTPPTSSFSEDVPLIPYGGTSGKHLVYLNVAYPLENFSFPEVPEIYFNYRCNPVMSVGDPRVLVKAMKKVKLLVALAYVHSEMTELADIVLPEHNDLERYELAVLPGDGDYAAGKKFRGAILRQPVVDPLHNTMEISDIFTELADRAGFLDDYNASVSKFFGLTGSYKLDSGKKYSWEDIVNLHCLAATDGQHDLAWFKENGSIMQHADVLDQYGIHLGMTDAGLRYPIPYLEHVKRTGESLKEKLNELGVEWWDTSEYVALPTFFPSVLDTVPKDYDFYLTTYASMQFSYGQNVTLPLLLELADHVLGQVDVMMNTKTAEARGIKDGDYVWVESEVGRFKQKVKLREGIRPDTIAITSFGQYATPLIKDKGWNTPGSITPIKPEWTDPVTGTMQGLVIKVKVYKAEHGENE
jgi:phenylacetyl-CoA:acceptor oxidoreductase